MNGKKVRKRKGRVGRPPKAPADRAQGFKLWLAGRDAAALKALSKAKRLPLPQYVLGLVRDDLARAAVGAESGPVTDAQLFEVARGALALAESCKAELKGAKP